MRALATLSILFTCLGANLKVFSMDAPESSFSDGKPFEKYCLFRKR